MKKTLLIFGAAVALLSCVSKPADSKNTKQTKSLVIFYSQTGATEKVANLLAEKSGADIDSVVAVNPYNGNFGETIARCQEEKRKGELPELKPLTKDIAKYDTLYIGSPVWFGTMAPPMESYLKQVDLSGKVVVPFVTFGSGGLETTVADMKKAQAKATFLDGYCIRNARVDKAAEEVEQFLVDIKVRKGKASEKLVFSEPKLLTEEDKKIFDEACGDYPMPLGTPSSVSFCIRQNGVAEYQFVVESKDAQGKDSKAIIFVTKAKDQKAEFTKVVR